MAKVSRCELCGKKVRKAARQCFECSERARGIALAKDIDFGAALAELAKAMGLSEEQVKVVSTPSA